MKKINILYITHLFPKGYEAHLKNYLLRTKVIKSLGINLLIFQHNHEHNYIIDFIKIIRKLFNIDIVIIGSIDGSSILEKFSLIKLFKPNLILLWEIHAPIEEAYWYGLDVKNKLLVFKRNVKRKILAKLVNATICVSKQISDYAENELLIKNNFIISNFIDRHDFIKINKSNHKSSIYNYLANKNFFKIVWAGGANFPWQSLNLIEKIAQNIYKIDKNIIFIIIGSDIWYRFKFSANIIFLNNLQYDKYLYLISQMDLCLALYNNNQRLIGPFYFSPMKILDYMGLAKPVIATNIGQLLEIIDNGENGYLSDNSTNDLINKTLLIRRNPILARQIGNRAQNKVFNDYGLNNARTQYKNMFKKLGILN